MSSLDREQLAVWVEQELDETLSADDFNQLQQMLTDDPKARQLYLELRHQNAHLQLERAHLSATGPLSGGMSNSRPAERSQSSRKVLWLSVCGALAASLLLVLWWNPRLGGPAVVSPAIAQMTDSCDAEWGDCTLPTAIGSSLGRGRLKIERGLTTILFASGAEVTLESPAELEIQSPLRCRLLAGTAVVEVPESAHGFTLATPTAVAIDHGTAFSVTVDRSSQASSIEVIDGEVEVQHIGSGDSRRLLQQERVVASVAGLGDSGVSSAEAQLSEVDRSGFGDEGLHRITTADGRGRDSSISRSQSDNVLEHSRSELVLIKNPHHGYEGFSRKGYFAFDLTGVNGSKIAAAKFVLTLRPTGLGFASRVGDCEFIVYGLTDESGDDWAPGQMQWQTAPANFDGPAETDPQGARELARFVVQRGRQHGQVSIDGNEFVRFLNEDTNKVVTLIVVRVTKENEPGGLVHGFANHSNSSAAPPTLLIQKRP